MRYKIVGKVVRGNMLGRRLGFPTANISTAVVSDVVDGVYAATVRLGVVLYGAVANVGDNPSIGGGIERHLEIHLLDFDGDLYDREIEVELVEFLRPEERFDSLEALGAQIARDVESSRRILGDKKIIKR